MELSLTLLFLGLFLVFIEFFLPGGIFALLGTIILIGSIWSAFTILPFLYGILFLIAEILLITVTCSLALYFIRRSSSKNSLFLKEDQSGFQAVKKEISFIGQTGKTTTELRPFGYISIKGRIVAAKSEEGYIENNVDVIIFASEGASYIVRKKEV